MFDSFCGLSRAVRAARGRRGAFGGQSWRRGAGLALCISGCGAGLWSATLPLPNGSFESPGTVYVDTRIDSWQKTPKPPSWDEATQGPWDVLTGLFANAGPGDPRHIVNCDGAQAAWLFANPQVGFFQDYDSTDWSNAVPPHTFQARFEAGKSYQLTVGVRVGAYPMREGATLELGLYYRDEASNRVAVATTIVTNLAAVFSDSTRLVDFQVTSPVVKAGDPWAGRHLGVQLVSTVDEALAGGYWELDNARLVERREPILLAAAASQGRFGFWVESEPGLRLEILATTGLGPPWSNWRSVATVTNETGRVAFEEPASGLSRRFYQARQLP